MIAILALLLLLGLVIYVMVFWSPNEGSTNSADTGNAPPRPVFSSPVKSAPVRLEMEKKWYGVSFRGFRDEYGFSTSLSLDKVVSEVRGFYCSRKAKVLLEEKQRLLFSRGKWIYGYLGGLDTLPIQEIEVACQAAGEITGVLIQYRVKGVHIRIPPNQLRREVLELLKSLGA